MNVNGQFREDEVVVRKSKINDEWTENRYVKVGGKLRLLHQDNDQVSIVTEIVRRTVPQPSLFRSVGSQQFLDFLIAFLASNL